MEGKGLFDSLDSQRDASEDALILEVNLSWPPFCRAVVAIEPLTQVRFIRERRFARPKRVTIAPDSVRVRSLRSCGR